MTTQDIINELSKSGHKVTYWSLRGIVKRGEIPHPKMNSSLCWVWTVRDLERLKKLLKTKETVA